VTTEKYGPQAEGWSEDAYADAESYLAHRAALVVDLGLPLAAGETVLDLACGDGGFAEHLKEFRYLGVDASPEMVAAGKRRGRDVVLGDLNDYEPPEPVAATTCFRAVYYARDRAAFFTRVAGYTQRKFVFDLNPRQYHVADVRADLCAAGFDRLGLRPFFAPQTVSLPRPVTTALHVLERSGPFARLLLAVRFSYLCAAFRGGRNT
jgi:SAM-dependent methyltransferase